MCAVLQGGGGDSDQLTAELLEMLADEEEDYFKLEEAAEAAQQDLATAASRLSSYSSSGPGEILDQGACMAAHALLLQQHQQRRQLVQHVDKVGSGGLGRVSREAADKLAAWTVMQPRMPAPDAAPPRLKH